MLPLATSVAGSGSLAAIGVMAGAAEPLFEAGPVSFFQSSDLSDPIRPLQRLEKPSLQIQLGSNERCFQHFYPAIEGQGGTLFGIGSLQNLNLAAVSRASGLICMDADPNVTMGMAMLLPLIPKLGGPDDFASVARDLVHRDGPIALYLDNIPSEYQAAFEGQIENLRTVPIVGPRFRRFIDAYQSRHDSFLGHPDYYDRIASMVQLGGVSVIYGNLFSPELPDLVAGALSYHEAPIRTLYFSNALEWCQVHLDESLLSVAGLVELFNGPHVDPLGRVLMTTEIGATPEIIAARASDNFTYHARPTGQVGPVLRQAGRLSPWLGAWKRDPQVIANDLNQTGIA